MSTRTRELFDSGVLSIPPPAELMAESAWLAEVPGLPEAAGVWAQEIPEAAATLGARARRLARGEVDKAMLSAMGRTAGTFALLTLLDLLGAYTTPARDRNELSDDRSLRRLENLVRAGGPAWVKLGQFIATSGGLLPDTWVEAFAWCRDEVDPLPYGQPRQIVRRAFQCRVRDIFAEFDDAPLGAASIAQVHRAVLHDGREVVVKIRRPGLRRKFRSDIRAMAGAARAAELMSPVARTGNVSGFVELFARLVLEELDFRIEAYNMIELGAAAEHAGADYVRFPRPIPQLVTERVLVMERLPGVAYTSAALGDVEGETLLRLAIEGILEHTLIYGVFHGDLHAGNVLLDGDGTFSLVDFGIVGRLDEHQRTALGAFLIAFARMDVRLQLEAMVRFGAIPPGIDLDSLVDEIESEVNPHELAEDAQVAELAAAIGRLVRVLSRHGIRMPKELVLFFKNLLYLNGFASAVAPDAALLAQVGPVFGYFQSKYGDAMDVSVLLS
ncbi:MAG: protein kinase UbiB [Acidimicrobiales bacterium]|nr:MAG: AarF/ABC1/UbiB kinase family protein [Actinomycetota bacterium]MBV6508988.1 protein kinase UbiB [Acidimicrobiales bacterium]RIK06297.1 MAG: ubiquinone biosynthesis protein UbiB [Acidobacteriota bacterium]